MPERIQAADQCAPQKEGALDQQKNEQEKQPGVQCPYRHPPLGESITLLQPALQSLGIIAQRPDDVQVLKMAEMIGKYERLRLAGVVPESVKAKLREPGKDFILTEISKGKWQFTPVQYENHKVISKGEPLPEIISMPQ